MRTPSMTVAEAEAAIGPRPVHVNAANRNLVKKWLVARGLPARGVGLLPVDMLALAYNGGVGGFATVAAEANMRAGEVDRGERPAPEGTEPVIITSPLIITPPPAVVPSNLPTVLPGDAGAAANALRVLLGLDKSAIDAEAVARIVDTRIAEALRDIPTHRLEIKIADRPAVPIEGARHEVFPTVLAVLAQGINVALVGPAGCGKSHMADQIAEALGNRPIYVDGLVSSEYRLSGYQDAHGHYVTTAFRQAYETGGLYVAEEMDAWSPSAFLYANGGLANGFQAFPDQRVKRHPDFVALACMNTYGNGADRLYVGRNQMDASTLDRFGFVAMDYDERLERALYGDTDWTRYVHKARASVRKLGIRHVVSSRAIEKGLPMLMSGMERALVEAIFLWKGLAPADIAKIKSGM